MYNTHCGKVFKNLEILENPILFLHQTKDGSLDYIKTRAVITVGIRSTYGKDIHTMVMKGRRLLPLIERMHVGNNIAEIYGIPHDAIATDSDGLPICIDGDYKYVRRIHSIHVITIDGFPNSVDKSTHSTFSKQDKRFGHARVWIEGKGFLDNPPPPCQSCDYQIDGVIQDSCVDCLDEEYNDLQDAMPGDQELIQARIQHMSERQTERGGHTNDR